MHARPPLHGVRNCDGYLRSVLNHRPGEGLGGLLIAAAAGDHLHLPPLVKTGG